MKKAVVFLFALGVGGTVLLLGGLAFNTPITPSGIFYLLGLGLVSLGGVIFPWGGRRAWIPLGAGLLIFCLTAGTRIATTHGSDQLYVITLPENGGTRRGSRWIDRLVDERDLSMFGVRIMPFIGWILPGEKVGAIPAFQMAYDEIHTVGGTVPSPVPATYLGLQRPRAFDAVIVEAEGTDSPKAGAIFLHGFTGNFLMECWLFSKAAREAGLLTVCPSAGFIGDWWKPYEAEIFEETLAYLHARGVERVYLAGLSNGGVGAGVLGSQYADQLAGLILISGLSLETPASGLPTLVIQGREDGRMPVSRAQEYARLVPEADYHEFAGDHFVLAKKAEGVQTIIREWLIQQESPK